MMGRWMIRGLQLATAAALALGAAGVGASQAQAEPARCTLALAQPEPNLAALEVVKTRALHHFRQRPYLRVPNGVALLVRAPTGVTEADLYQALKAQAKAPSALASPLAVPGAELEVARKGGLYEIRITHDTRSAALEIQQRAGSCS